MNFFLSRDTVQKAYGILEKDRIIHAVPGKGFYINRTDITLPYRVLLIFNKLSSYKKMIYEGFVKTMTGKGNVDLKIHHSNVKVLEEIVNESLGEYDYYLVMPHFYDHLEEVNEILKLVPAEKLILLDKTVPGMFLNSTAIYQDFENDIVAALEAGLDCLRKYHTLIYVNPVFIPRPRRS
jgi:DNA-binding transcriptional regulator YhcF (GntR family)